MLTKNSAVLFSPYNFNPIVGKNDKVLITTVLSPIGKCHKAYRPIIC